MNHAPHTSRRSRRGFSLLEVLIAVLILGIGLIMVASIFPVGADWTRQSAQQSIAQNLAMNAVAIVKSHYIPNGAASPFTAAATDTNDAWFNTATGQWTVAGAAAPLPRTRTVFTLPNFGTTIPISERSYAVGTDQPFPVPSVAPNNRCPEAQYCWTALMRIPDDNSTTVTLYILVFHRGSRNQTFNQQTNYTVNFADGTSNALTELADARSATNDIDANNGNKIFAPSLWSGPYLNGKSSTGAAGGDIVDCWPPLGGYGIGMDSGTVFRQVINTDTSSSNAYMQAVPRPQLAQPGGTTEPVITAVPPDGWSSSSLVYVYQTQLSF